MCRVGRCGAQICILSAKARSVWKIIWNLVLDCRFDNTALLPYWVTGQVLRPPQRKAALQRIFAIMRGGQDALAHPVRSPAPPLPHPVVTTASLRVQAASCVRLHCHQSAEHSPTRTSSGDTWACDEHPQ